MAKYFITGATGTVGSEVVRALLAKNQSVITGSRNPEKSRELFGSAVEAVHFDFEQTSTYSVAKGVDGVFVLGPPLNPRLYELIEPFLDFLEKEGPQRLVYLSGNGMHELESLPFHAKAEAKIKQSNLDWRIVRPGFFMQNFGNYDRENIEERKVIFSPAGEEKTAFVSTVDIGRSVAQLLVDDQYKQQIFTLTGTEAFNFSEVAAILSKTLGEPITYPNPDEATYRKVLSEAGAPTFIADYMVPIYGMIKDGKVTETTNDVARLTGQQPEQLKDVLARDFA